MLFAASCGRSSLYLSEWTEGETGGLGAGGGSGRGGASAARGGSGGSATPVAGTGSARGGSGAGGARGGTSGLGQGGSGGTTVPRGGSAGKAGGSSGAAGKPPLLHCRDGVVDPGEECDAGEGPYAHPALELLTNNIRIDLSPVIGTEDIADYYDYYDDSSHTGKENVSGSKIYFYRPYYETGAYLVTHHGIDFGATGFVQPTGKVHFFLSGLPATAFVLLSDDSGEAVKDSLTTVEAEWEFAQESDGLVLAGIPFPGTWHILLEPEFIEGIDTFTAISGDGYRTGLALVRDVELIASEEAGGCRRDCTIPRCGDGRVDAGETCDDGNDDDDDLCARCQPLPNAEPLR